MKKIIALGVSVLSFNAFSVERSLTLHSGQNFTGSYVDFYNEQIVNEEHSVTNHTTNTSSYTSHLEPVGDRQASSVEVSEGYCAIFSKNEFFGGSWLALKPGNYASLGSFDNAIVSAATYKMLAPNQNICDPEKDIPILYENTHYSGKEFPLVFPNGYVDPEAAPGFWQGISAIDAQSEAYGALVSSQWRNTVPKVMFIGGRLVTIPGVRSPSGGFSRIASSLKVPQCYEVTLLASVLHSGSVSTHTFGPGSYPNLSIFGMNDNTVNYIIKRDPSCQQPASAPLPSDNWSLGSGVLVYSPQLDGAAAPLATCTSGEKYYQDKGYAYNGLFHAIEWTCK